MISFFSDRVTFSYNAFWDGSSRCLGTITCPPRPMSSKDSRVSFDLIVYLSQVFTLSFSCQATGVAGHTGELDAEPPAAIAEAAQNHLCLLVLVVKQFINTLSEHLCWSICMVVLMVCLWVHAPIVSCICKNAPPSPQPPMLKIWISSPVNPSRRSFFSCAEICIYWTG